MKPKINDNKTIREESTKELLYNLLQIEINTLSQLQKKMLIEVLINGKTFGELKENLGLTSSRQRVVFKNGVNNLSKALLVMNDKLKAYDLLQAELLIAQRLIKNLEGQIEKKASINPKLKKLLSLSIDKTGLSARVLTVCSWAGVNTVSDLVRCSKRKFLGFRNCGKTSMVELEEFLNKNNLSWEMDV